ncbi:brain protein I3-like isoform X2 [Mercenaria mercenaria]|uniref:brain protein I3-like isoform X2 n=1 Tax=Mercenaria mercenaria TaxID=6596 RepID=UPI00234F2DAF|nr:brain protein I3-like isoform X2 [Mercenaria mercenaria]
MAVQYGNATVVPVGYPQPQPSVVVVQGNPRQHVQGLCPYCGVGVPQKSFTLLGIILAFVFFPIGILCCLAMKERTCGHCHATI